VTCEEIFRKEMKGAARRKPFEKLSALRVEPNKKARDKELIKPETSMNSSRSNPIIRITAPAN
jgi:hypothetical protein